MISPMCAYKRQGPRRMVALPWHRNDSKTSKPCDIYNNGTVVSVSLAVKRMQTNLMKFNVENLKAGGACACIPQNSEHSAGPSSSKIIRYESHSLGKTCSIGLSGVSQLYLLRTRSLTLSTELLTRMDAFFHASSGWLIT